MKKIYSISMLCVMWAFILFANSSLAVQVTLLQNSNDALQARADFINAAKSSITAQYFIIDHDEISMTYLALLRNAALRGVQVRILVDSLHNYMTRQAIAALHLNLHEHERNNIEVREFNASNPLHLSSVYKRMHDKSLVIDEQVLIVGGRNISNGYFDLNTGNTPQNPVEDLRSNIFGTQNPNYQDSDMIVFGGQATQDAVKYFEQIWQSKNVTSPHLFEFEAKNLAYGACVGSENYLACQESRDKNVETVKSEEKKFDAIIEVMKSLRSKSSDLPNSDTMLWNSGANWKLRAFDSSDAQFLMDPVYGDSADKRPNSGIGAQLYRLIESKAQKSVFIVTPYFVVTAEQKALFKRLIAKGVQITIATNSRKSTDVLSAQAGYEIIRGEVADLGVKILEYSGPDTLHAKMVLVDSTDFFIGSYNWDPRSENLNREVGVFVRIPESQNEAFVQDLKGKIDTIVARSMPYGGRAYDVQESIKDFFNLDFRSKRVMIWKFLYPLVKNQL